MKKPFFLLCGLAVITWPTALAQQAPILASQTTPPVTICNNAYYGGGFRVTPDGAIYNKDDLSILPHTAVLVNAMQQLRRAFGAHGTTLVPVILPLRGMLRESEIIPNHDYEASARQYDRLITQLRTAGFTVPNLVQTINSTSRPEPVFLRRDHHISPYGASVIAQEVAQTLRGLPLYAALAKTKFTTTHQPQTFPYTDQSRAFQANEWLCDSKLPQTPAEQVELFTTTATTQSSDLLGDEPVPDVAMVGSSQSKQTLNLPGWIKQDSDLDVLVDYVSAGGTWLGMQDYLLSRDFQEHPPKVLLWELPLDSIFAKRSDAPNGEDFRIVPQLLAAIQGKCDAPTVPVANNQLLIPAQSVPSYAVADTPDVAHANAVLNVGNKTQNINLSERLKNRNTIYISLPIGRASSLSLPGSTAAWTAKICQVR